MLLIHALINYVNPATKKLGQQMLVLAVSEHNVQKGSGDGEYKGWVLTRASSDSFKRLDSQPHVARSYAAGTSPEAGYELPDDISVTFRLQDKYVGDASKGEYKVFVWSSGADSARPVMCRKNDKGVWKCHEYSSLTLGVKPPAKGPCAGPKVNASDDL